MREKQKPLGDSLKETEFFFLLPASQTSWPELSQPGLRDRNHTLRREGVGVTYQPWNSLPQRMIRIKLVLFLSLVSG